MRFVENLTKNLFIRKVFFSMVSYRGKTSKILRDSFILGHPLFGFDERNADLFILVIESIDRIHSEKCFDSNRIFVQQNQNYNRFRRFSL